MKPTQMEAYEVSSLMETKLGLCQGCMGLGRVSYISCGSCGSYYRDCFRCMGKGKLSVIRLAPPRVVK